MLTLPFGSVPRHYAQQAGERVCLRHSHENEALTWSELDARACQWARALHARGVSKDDVVTIGLPNCNKFYEVLFGIWKLGATPNLVSSKLPKHELCAILELAKPKLIVGWPEEFVAGHSLVSPQWRPAEYSREPLQSRVATYWKMMTSGGSTGRPKLIVEHWPSNAEPDAPVLEIPRHSTVLIPGPLHHNAPFALSTAALAKGNQVIGMDRFDPEIALRLIEEHRVEWALFVPTMMHRIWKLPAETRARYDLASLKLLVHMAAPMPIWLKEAWIEWLGPQRIAEFYGGTEGGAAWITGEEWLAHKGSVGKTGYGTEFRVLDKNGEVCPPGTIGDIYMLPSTGTAPSYPTYHYVGAQSQRRSDGWDTLGDIGWLDAEGYLYLADRRTDLIISGGANIYPAEVESALLQHASVYDAVVVGLPDDDLGQRVHAIVSLRPEHQGKLDEPSLREFLAEKMVKYKIPRTFEFISGSLRGDDGKVRRSELRQQRIDKLPDDAR